MINRRFVPIVLLALIASLSLGDCFFRRVSLLNPADARFAQVAPDSFDVELTTH